MSTLDLYKKYYNELSKIKAEGIICCGKVFFADIYKRLEFEKVMEKVHEYEQLLAQEGYSII